MGRKGTDPSTPKRLAKDAQDTPEVPAGEWGTGGCGEDVYVPLSVFFFFMEDYVQ